MMGGDAIDLRLKKEKQCLRMKDGEQNGICNYNFNKNDLPISAIYQP